MAFDPITKSDLRIGTRIIIRGESLDRVRFNLGGTSDIVEVCDLMDRTNYCKPDRIGVKRSGTGLALGIAMADITDVIA